MLYLEPTWPHDVMLTLTMLTWSEKGAGIGSHITWRAFEMQEKYKCMEAWWSGTGEGYQDRGGGSWYKQKISWKFFGDPWDPRKCQYMVNILPWKIHANPTKNNVNSNFTERELTLFQVWEWSLSKNDVTVT